EQVKVHFPRAGIIGEEHGLRFTPEDPDGMTVIMDGLDGTKAFNRRQQYGIGTMIAVIKDNQIIAAGVGNVNTGETIVYGPEDTTVIRERFGFIYNLKDAAAEKAEETYLQLGKAPDQYPPAMQAVLKRPEDGGLFKQINIMNGSIGTMTARLWCGEVGAMVTEPAYTPWDFAPVHGINKALGLIYLRPNGDGKLEIYEPEMFYEVRKPQHPFEIITRPEYVRAIMKAYNG
ncbi:MAG: Inositol monophosphatase family, partial [Candidatus Parcubacteria bacterium]